MAVSIRLSRAGRKNRPYWRIVAVDSRKQRDGQYIEKLGTYDPLRHEIITINVDNINAWIAKGAQCSDAVTKLVKKHKSAAA